MYSGANVSRFGLCTFKKNGLLIVSRFQLCNKTAYKSLAPSCLSNRPTSRGRAVLLVITSQMKQKECRILRNMSAGPIEEFQKAQSRYQYTYYYTVLECTTCWRLSLLKCLSQAYCDASPCLAGEARSFAPSFSARLGTELDSWPASPCLQDIMSNTVVRLPYQKCFKYRQKLYKPPGLYRRGGWGQMIPLFHLGSSRRGSPTIQAKSMISFPPAFSAMIR